MKEHRKNIRQKLQLTFAWICWRDYVLWNKLSLSKGTFLAFVLYFLRFKIFWGRKRHEAIHGEFIAIRETQELQNTDRGRWEIGDTCVSWIGELACTPSQVENKCTYDHANGFDNHNYRLGNTFNDVNQKHEFIFVRKSWK